MSITAEKVKTAITLDPAWQGEVRRQWLRMLELAVWGDLKGANPATGGRLRKRVLEVGERLRSLFNDRGWIPQPREQLKNLLGSCLAFHDSFEAMMKAAEDIKGGGDLAEFHQLLAWFGQAVVGSLRDRENGWAEMLERINAQAREEGDD